MPSEVKFYRGVKLNYNPEVYVDGIFFSTDTNEILVNDKSYSGNLISSIGFSGNVLTLYFSDGSNKTVQIPTASTVQNGLMSSQDKVKVNIITTAGSGVLFLADDGTYKPIDLNSKFDKTGGTVSGNTTFTQNVTVNGTLKQSNSFVAIGDVQYKIQNVTESEYSEIVSKDANTIYIITEN